MLFLGVIISIPMGQRQVHSADRPQLANSAQVAGHRDLDALQSAAPAILGSLNRDQILLAFPIHEPAKATGWAMVFSVSPGCRQQAVSSKTSRSCGAGIMAILPVGRKPRAVREAVKLTVEVTMKKTNKTYKTRIVLGALLLAAGTAGIGGAQAAGNGNFCMDVEIGPFHMVPGPEVEPGVCPVRDYLDGELQQAFYPFTIEDHPFNCETADFVTLPVVGMVPTWVVSEGEITGTIGGNAFSAMLYCASLTNWYQDYCLDPDDPSTCSFQLAQPFLKQGLPYPRVTEVSVFDGVVTVERGSKQKEVELPIIIATRAAGITHVEGGGQVGASITHSLLGMLALEDNDKDEVLEGSADLLLQGHIFSPFSVEEDDGPAVIKGAICSQDLYKRLNKPGPKDK
jgi:hypothetical protein